MPYALCLMPYALCLMPFLPSQSSTDCDFNMLHFVKFAKITRYAVKPRKLAEYPQKPLKIDVLH
jgi:hypothetical protein